MTFFLPSYSQQKIKVCASCVHKNTEDPLDWIYLLYNDNLVTDEKLLKTFSLPKDEWEKEILKIYNLLRKSDQNFEKLETFMKFAFSNFDLLLLKLDHVYSLNSKEEFKRFITYISFLLDLLHSISQKFSENLRGFHNLKTLDWVELQQLASLIRIGIKIVTYRATITNFIFARLKRENYFLWTKTKRAFFSNLESIEDDARYFMSTIKARNKEISEPTIRLNNLDFALELKLELSALRLQVSDDEIGHILEN